MDVLSQEEIDALINGINDGTASIDEPAEKQVSVRDYDFRTANRFNKEQIRTLNVIYDTFARLFSSYLSATLRAACSAEVISVEELKYNEFVNALPSPVVLSIVRMPPLTGSLLLEMSPDLAYAIISRLLGGQPDKETQARAFTEIELVLIERIMRQFLPLFGESWDKIVTVNTILDRIETSPQFAQIVALNETVAIITVRVQLDDAEGNFTICLPSVALEPINQQLTTKFLYQSTENHDLKSVQYDIRQRIEKTPLPVTAVFHDTPLSVREILNLQVGDIIPMDHKTNERLTLKVGHINKFIADIGTKDGRYALKISEIIPKEDAYDE